MGNGEKKAAQPELGPPGKGGFMRLEMVAWETLLKIRAEKS